MKQGLQLKFSQNLALTPQLQQSIRLLQLSTQELNQELESILQANPLLERDDKNPDGSDAGESYSPPSNNEVATSSEAPKEEAPQENFAEDFSEFMGSGRWDESSSPDDDNDFSFQESATVSLREHLLAQLKLMNLSERDMMLSMLLVDTINEDGYLEQPLEEVVELLSDIPELELEELEIALKHLQHLDPPGIGARNLSECLVLQLKALDADTPYRKMAITLAEKHLPLLAARDYNKLKRLLHCDDDGLRQAQILIKQMNPRPGSEFAHITTDHYVQHEVIVKKVKGIWLAHLNEEVIPKLRINQVYANILKRNRESSGQYLMSQMQEAKWMIKNIQQRFSTILRVSQAIVDRQRNFFEHGDVAMRPLVLREIADELELHESTISRVTTRKYMLTPRGVYELKYFFGSHVATESGGECSATAIRALIKQMVAEEDPKHPLSDNQITEILSKQGIVVARRTIAKYRESLNLPPASQRKTL